MEKNKRKKLFAIELELILFIVGYAILYKYSSLPTAIGLTFLLIAENLHVIRMVFSGNKDFWKDLWRNRNNKDQNKKP